MVAGHKARRLERAGGVRSRAAAGDVANHSLLVQDKSHALCHPEKTERAIELGNRFLRIAEERKGDAELLGETLVGGRTVDADAEDLRLGLLKKRETILVRFDLVRSGGCVGKNVERQDDILPAEKIAELDAVAVVVRKLEIRRRIADFQWRHVKARMGPWAADRQCCFISPSSPIFTR